jgi:cytosine/adenosine deaminase-related metal-dependent hydrolase
VTAGIGMASLLVRAAWVCPVAGPPLADGWVHTQAGAITAIGHGHDAPTADRVVDLGTAVVLPGLINAHTHLELSWLRDRVPPAPDFLSWVGQLMRLRTRLETPADVAAMAAMDAALDELQTTGTVAVGDISNALISPPRLRARGIPAVVFHELLGFRDLDGRAALAASAQRRRPVEAEGVRVVPAAHAPFSVSPELFRALADEVREARRPRTSVHVAESPEEVQLLRDGSGPWRQRLQTLGAWRDGWTPPGTGPGHYLCDLGVLTAGSLAVHGVQLTDRELDRLAANQVTLVTCPRSNRWVGVGEPPIARFSAAGVRLAVGTDSLASTPDLNLFGELAAMRAAAPLVPARWILRAATLAGAEALGMDDRLGSLAPGYRAQLVAVTLPSRSVDPEEALVAGVAADRIRVLSDGVAVEAGR